MSSFDDIKKQVDDLDERLHGSHSGKAQEAGGQAKERSGAYWFFRHSMSRMGGSIRRGFSKRPMLSTILYGMVLILLFSFRASYQFVFIFIRKYFIIAVIVLLLLMLCYWIWQRSRAVGKIMVVLLLGVLAVGMAFYGAPMINYLALYNHYQQLEKVELSQLPLTGNERIHPLNSVATLVAQEALNETESASSPDFIRRADGRYDFSMAIGPSPQYPLQRLFRNLDQVISVSAVTPAPDFSGTNRHNVNFDVGEQLWFGRKVEQAVIRRFGLWQYLSYEPDQVRFMENSQGEWVQVVSLIRWKGLFFPRPVFGGVMVVEQREAGFNKVLERNFLGKGYWVKAEQVDALHWLRGQNLLPDRASRFTAESFRFLRGFLAPFPGYHEGDIRIPDFPGDQNDMPYVTWFDFEGVSQRARTGLYDYYGLEPYLEGKSGLNLSLFLPGDGEFTAFYIDHALLESGLFGASAVPVKIRESRKEYDWSASSAAESRPFIRDMAGERRFFWLTTVVTKADAEGKTFVGGSMPDLTLTDALGRQVIWLERLRLADTRLWEEQILKEAGPGWGYVAPSDSLLQLINTGSEINQVGDAHPLAPESGPDSNQSPDSLRAAPAAP